LTVETNYLFAIWVAGVFIHMPLGLRGRQLVLRGGTRRDLHHTTPLVITALVRASRAGPSLTIVCIPAALVFVP
jgi:hypothetical protein